MSAGLSSRVLELLLVATLVASSVIAANFKIVSDVLDQTGGSASSSHFKLTVAAGGQPSPGGLASSSHFRLLGGFVYTLSVLSGDANGDGSVNISDAVSLIAYIFSGGPAPNPLEAGDANCDGNVNISDAVYLIVYIFGGGPAPCGG